MAATRRGRPIQIDWTGTRPIPAYDPKKKRRLSKLAIEQGLAAIEQMRNMQIAETPEIKNAPIE